MKRMVVAFLVTAAAAAAGKPKPAAPKPAAAPEKPIDAAFRAAFGKPGSALLKKQGELKEDVKYTPGDLVQAPWGPVLLSPGEVEKPSHVNSGKLAIVYLKPSEKGFEVEKKFVPAAETGSFGKIVEWSVSKSFGDLPIVTVKGAGNWQGYACSTATLIELTPDGPRRLVTMPMTYDNSGAVNGKGATQINGRIDNIQPKKGFDVVYFARLKGVQGPLCPQGRCVRPGRRRQVEDADVLSSIRHPGLDPGPAFLSCGIENKRVPAQGRDDGESECSWAD